MFSLLRDFLPVAMRKAKKEKKVSIKSKSKRSSKVVERLEINCQVDEEKTPSRNFSSLVGSFPSRSIEHSKQLFSATATATTPESEQLKT
jgi:hypothetical protein